MNLNLSFIQQLTTKQKQSLAITAGVALIVLVGLYIGVIQSQKSTRNANLKKIVEVTENLEKAKKQQKENPIFEQRLQEARTKLDGILAGFVPESEPNPWVTRTLGKFMDTCNLESLSMASVIMQSCSVFPNFPYQEALIKINFKTYYHNLGRFLARFENKYPYFRVQNMEISPILGGINQEDFEKLSVRIDLIAFISPKSTKP